MCRITIFLFLMYVSGVICFVECSPLLENGEEDIEHAPMFRTGLGNSVALKQSSIAKALSILEDNDNAISSGRCSFFSCLSPYSFTYFGHLIGLEPLKYFGKHCQFAAYLSFLAIFNLTVRKD